MRPGMSVLHQGEHQKVVEQPETEWQKKAKAKKGADYYSSYKQVRIVTATWRGEKRE